MTELLRARPHGSTRYEELPACGHVPMQEQPEAFCAAVAPFLREVLGGASAAAAPVRRAPSSTARHCHDAVKRWVLSDTFCHRFLIPTSSIEPHIAHQL